MLSKVASSTIFWVFGMTRPGIRTQVSQAMGKHSNHYANVRCFLYKSKICKKAVHHINTGLLSVWQIQKVTSYKRVTVQPLTSHLTNYLCKTSKTCWVLLEKQRWTHKQVSPMDGYQQCWSTSKNLHSSTLWKYWV